MTTQIDITQRNHRRAVRFFWAFLIGATTVSLIGNITHAVLPYITRIDIQIGAAALPPIALLAAVHASPSPSPSVPEPPAGVTSGRSALLPPSVGAHSR
jgi:hypothetical protein